MQIKEEKLKKRLEKMGGKRGRDEKDKEEKDSDSDGDGGLFTIKKRHDWGAGGEVDEDLEIIRRRDKKVTKKQKIRADGTAGMNKKTTFDDDGMEVDDSVKLVNAEGIKLEEEEREYVERVKERLGREKEEDKRLERERVREKRKKQRGNDDDSEGEEGGEMQVVMGRGSEGGRNSSRESEGSGSSDSDSGSNSRSDSESTDDEGEGAAKKAEAMLLAGL